MRRPVFILGLMMCGGVAVSFGENRYGRNSAVAGDGVTWRPNPFLQAEPTPVSSPAPARPGERNRSGPRRVTDPSLPDRDPRRVTSNDTLSSSPDRYPWKLHIVTTTFWIGEHPSANNPVPNHQSAWDKHWSAHYGGYDNPEPAARRHYIPATFVPRQNPFYVALPYNDVEGGHTKSEAASVIPWFKEAFVRDGQTILKGRWLSIRHGGRVCYAQWEDCGPFRTDHWQYVFGAERPRPNLNQGAGLDVSPAVRDYLGLGNKDVCDWKFVESGEVPSGPWKLYGGNNPFVLSSR